jgi:hypothetical protein
VIARVDDPNVKNAEIQVVIDLLLNSLHSVFRGKNLDANKRWRPKNLFTWPFPDVDADIRDSKANGAHLNTLFRKNIHLPFLLPLSKKEDDFALYLAVIAFAHVPLLHLTVNIVTVRVVRRLQILFH